MDNLLKDADWQNLIDGLNEAQSLTCQRVIIRRVTFGAKPADIRPAPRTVVDIPILANVTSVSAQEIADAGGIFKFGDLKMETDFRILEVNTNGQQADRLVYNGKEFTLIGRPTRYETAGGGVVYSETIWRQS
jgi:hypothetical protein